MESHIDDLFRHRAVKWWIAVQVVGIVAWLAVIAVMTWVGADFLVVAIGAVLLAFAAGFVFDPRRPWWGAGPTAALIDPAARRRYQRVMTIWLVAALALMFVVPLVMIASGILAAASA